MPAAVSNEPAMGVAEPGVNCQVPPVSSLVIKSLSSSCSASLVQTSYAPPTPAVACSTTVRFWADEGAHPAGGGVVRV